MVLVLHLSFSFHPHCFTSFRESSHRGCKIVLTGQRWPSLRRSLECPTKHVCLLNPFAVSEAWTPRDQQWTRIRHWDSNTTILLDPTEEELLSPSPPPPPVFIRARCSSKDTSCGNIDSCMLSHYLLDGASPLPGEENVLLPHADLPLAWSVAHVEGLRSH